MKWLALVSLALCSSLVGCMNMAAREAAPATLETWDADGATSEPGFVSYKDAGRSADSAGAPAQGPSEVLLEAPKAARQVIYSASLSIVVLSPAAAQASVKSLAEAAGGWMSESDARTITVRVPAAQFEALLERVGQLGEVVDRSVRAEDITETLVELDIRIDNARRARERLVAHLEKSEKMEDTLRIEAELGPVDIAVFNATGPQPLKPIEDYDWAFYQEMYDFFVKSPFLVTRRVLPHMKKQRWGRIINITSEVFRRGTHPFSAYVAAKGAQTGWTRAMAGELAPWGITVNAVAPGWIPVERHANDPEEMKEGYRKLIPMGHFGIPSDVAGAVAFLASDAARFITAADIPVNGGMTVT